MSSGKWNIGGFILEFREIAEIGKIKRFDIDETFPYHVILPKSRDFRDYAYNTTHKTVIFGM